MDSSYAARAESRDISLQKSTKDRNQEMLYFMQYDILHTISREHIEVGKLIL